MQTGYLTIHEVETTKGDERFYTLGYPNLEVERSFGKHLLKGFGELGDAEMGTALRKMYKALQAGDVDGLLEQLKVFFAGIPYDIQLNNEKYYQSLFVANIRTTPQKGLAVPNHFRPIWVLMKVDHEQILVCHEKGQLIDMFFGTNKRNIQVKSEEICQVRKGMP